jgi:hypothetical protein
MFACFFRCLSSDTLDTMFYCGVVWCQLVIMRMVTMMIMMGVVVVATVLTAMIVRMVSYGERGTGTD